MGSEIYCSKSRLILYTLFWIAVAVGVGLGVYFGVPCRGGGSGSGLTGGSTTASSPSAEPWKSLRLPRHIMPSHYDLTLHPDFYSANSGWFYGNVSIEIDVIQDTNVIMVHIKDMTVTRTEVLDKDSGTNMAIAETFHYAPNQFWVVKTRSNVKAGKKITLTLDFDGSLENGIVGFYKSTYVNTQTNQTRYLATSKFEPVDARKAFPCFDEPNIKAEYTVTLVHRGDYTALSNMPQSTNRTLPSGLVSTTFQRSVPMSTYLVCFIVCDFKYMEAISQSGKPFRVYATPDKISQAQYALDVGKAVLDLYENVFNQSYPLPKQDMVAIPDFVSGAMEHWGVITYRETNLLYDANQASASNKQRVAAVIAHEMAHQWFGNIVTMDWWDDLWLNEGFASFMEYKGVMEVEPDWDMEDQFLTEDMQPVMPADSVLSSHPIVVPVNNPDEITEVFDSISYSKGSSVIRMLQHVMGEKDFYYGIQTYLRRFEYGNARTDDLWEELQKAPSAPGRPPVKTIMDTWTRQMGYPVITVSFTRDTAPKIKVAQSRFLLDPSANLSTAEPSDYGYKWYVPLTHRTSDGRSGMRWMKGEESIAFDSPINPASSVEWIKFNVNQTSFYRVNYPVEQWNALSRVLESSHESLSVSDRSGLIDDAFNLAKAEHTPYSTVLGMISYLDKEVHYLPWHSAYRGISYISRMLKFTGTYDKWRKYVINLVRPAMARLGWNNTGSHLDKMSRSDIIRLACLHDDESCLNNGVTLLNGWINDQTIIQPDLRTLVYQFGMKKAGRRKEWDYMWKEFQTTPSPQQRYKLLYGMAWTSEIRLLERYLDYAMDPSKIRDQDFFTVISYINQNPVGANVVWDFVRKNYDDILARFDLGNRYFGRMVPGIIGRFTTAYQLQQAEEFFAKYPEAGAGTRARATALEKIKANIEWTNTHEASIARWLDDNSV